MKLGVPHPEGLVPALGDKQFRDGVAESGRLGQGAGDTLVAIKLLRPDVALQVRPLALGTRERPVDQVELAQLVHQLRPMASSRGCQQLQGSPMREVRLGPAGGVRPVHGREPIPHVNCVFLTGGLRPGLAVPDGHAGGAERRGQPGRMPQPRRTLSLGDLLRRAGTYSVTVTSCETSCGAMRGILPPWS
jgi:hypothetical protein